MQEAKEGWPESVVSPSCALLTSNVGCCVLFVSEYPLESWLYRSFGLGRKALTSAFHSDKHNRSRGPESTTKYVCTCSPSLLSPCSPSRSRLLSLYVTSPPPRLTWILVGNVDIREHRPHPCEHPRLRRLLREAGNVTALLSPATVAW